MVYLEFLLHNGKSIIINQNAIECIAEKKNGAVVKLLNNDELIVVSNSYDEIKRSFDIIAKNRTKKSNEE